MRITFNRDKRTTTLKERGLDFADARKVFAGRHATLPDDRKAYGEPRFISAGLVDNRLVVTVWTPRGVARRIISMRYAHDKEAHRWRIYLDRPG
jgi:uncharacterized DUF497 family protein